MNKTIIIRTIKTALAAILAIIVAKKLYLEYASAAGIIAILNILETRKATTEAALKKNFISSHSPCNRWITI